MLSIGGLIESICCISLMRRIRPFSKPDSPDPACLAFRAVPGVVARHLFSKLGVKLSDLVSVRLLASEAIHVVTEYFLQRRDSVRSVSTHEKFPSVHEAHFDRRLGTAVLKPAPSRGRSFVLVPRRYVRLVILSINRLPHDRASALGELPKYAL